MVLDTKNSKSALGSVTVWGSILGFGVSAIAIAQQVISDPSILAIIPPHIVPYVAAAGAIITFIGRITAKKQITGIVTPSS